MGKPIQETIFKSRLTITYRADIGGTVQQVNLPYRLLVLGEFSGRAMRADRLLPDLAEREIKSIKRGTTVNDHLSETVPIWRIPATPGLKALQSHIPGKVTFDHVVCNVPRGAIARNESATLLLHGTAKFESSMAQNGLCDLEGQLRVGGKISVEIAGGVVTAKVAEVIVSGAVSGHYTDPATGKRAGIVTAFIETTSKVESGITIAPDTDTEHAPAEGLNVQPFVVTMAAFDVTAERTVPFPSIDAFAPDAIASAIPELRRLQVIKQLLTDLQSGMRNRPELRKLVKTLLPAYGSSADEAQKKLAPFNDLKAWAEDAYPLLKIERTTTVKASNGDTPTA